MHTHTHSHDYFKEQHFLFDLFMTTKTVKITKHWKRGYPESMQKTQLSVYSRKVTGVQKHHTQPCDSKSTYNTEGSRLSNTLRLEGA